MPTTLAPALVALVLCAAPPPEKQVKALPTLARDLKIDGDLKDFAPAADFKMPESATGSSAALKVKAAFRKDTLFVGVTVQDDAIDKDDLLSVTLYFPESGVTSRGFVYQFGHDGVRPPPPESGAPAFTQALLKAGVKDDKKGYTMELAFPGRTLPRFQASRPLVVSICVDYSDVDSEGGEPTRLTTCPTAEMVGGPTRLPDELRKNLKLTPPPEAEGLEGHEKGWVAYSKLHYPMWALGDSDFTAESLVALVAPDVAVDPASVALPIPKSFTLPDNRPLFTVLTGKNPFQGTTCAVGSELRLAMYVVKANVAARVLEWPVATCTLGRAMSFDLGPDGTFAIGYTNGSTARFSWTAEHFERAELGRRD